MIWNLLTNNTEQPTGGCDGWGSWLMIGILFAIIIVWMVFSRRSQKKHQDEVQNTLNAVGPGNKVKTIGGICGIVVEVNNEDNTFILETGSETTGKCYIKFDKQAIYQTDALTKKPEANAEETPAEASVEEPVAEETAVEEPAQTEEKKD